VSHSGRRPQIEDAENKVLRALSEHKKSKENMRMEKIELNNLYHSYNFIWMI
jgi:hypothetical protein